MINMKEIKSEGSTNNLRRILKGSITAIVITFVLLLIYAILLTYTNLNENTMSITIIIITAISILAGSFISSMNIKKIGLTSGMLVGLIYIITIYSIIMITSSVVAGAVGGIVGVNIKKN